MRKTKIRPTIEMLLKTTVAVHARDGNPLKENCKVATNGERKTKHKHRKEEEKHDRNRIIMKKRHIQDMAVSHIKLVELFLSDHPLRVCKEKQLESGRGLGGKGRV